MSSDGPTNVIVDEEGRNSSPWRLPARWRLEVRSSDDSNLRFRAAIACDGHLELVEAVAPYDKEFSATRVIALFESVEECDLSVVAFSDASGMYTRQCSFSGARSARILFDSNIQAYQAGSL